MKTPEEIFDECLQARGIDRIGLQDAEVYEAGLDAIKKALSLGDVVGHSEQLKAFLEWQQKRYIKPYDTPIDEQIKDYEESL